MESFNTRCLCRISPGLREKGLRRFGVLAGLVVILGSCVGVVTAASTQNDEVSSDSTSPRVIPGGPRGQAISEGLRIVTDSPRELKDWVSSGLTCANCHLGAGTVPGASPWTGIFGVFPEYRARTGKMISLQERINECMQRSLNGRALPFESHQMDAVLAYIQWLSEGTPTGQSPPGRGFGSIDTRRVPDSANGSRIYRASCAMCHGADGEGVRRADGTFAFPPLWGDASFNIGAGMARTYTAAAFIRGNMPQNAPGSLSEQEAIDVAEFVTHQARPDFPARRADWPHGDAPKDARKDD